MDKREINEILLKIKEKTQYEIDNHIHYLKGFYVFKINSELIISFINIEEDETIKETKIDLILPEKIDINTETKLEIINKIKKYLSSKEIHLDDRVNKNKEINLKNLKNLKVKVYFSIFNMIDDEQIEIYNNKLTYYNKLKEESGTKKFDHKIEKYTHKLTTVGGYSCVVNLPENRNIDEDALQLYMEPGILNIENIFEQLIILNLRFKSADEKRNIFRQIINKPEIRNNFIDLRNNEPISPVGSRPSDIFVNYFNEYISHINNPNYFNAKILQFNNNGVALILIQNYISNLQMMIRIFSVLKTCNYTKICDLFIDYIVGPNLISGITYDILNQYIQITLPPIMLPEITPNFTEATFNNNTWRLLILRYHVHGLSLAHNGFKDDRCGKLVLDELNLNNNNKNRYLGYQIIHSYLHILDEIPLLNPDAHLIDDSKDTRWCIIKDQLDSMRTSFSPSLYRCIERLLNYNRNSVFEKDATGQLYNSPYLLVAGAYYQKYRQLHNHDISYIKPEFRHATHNQAAVYVGPGHGNSVGNTFSNDDRIGEVNI
jgi:hypothetical protein